MKGVGGTLFAARGFVPVPLVLGLIWVARGPGWLALPGAILLAAGESLRLWGVAHIGPRSRTRGAEVGSLVTTGPYAWCRNPLYLGNLALFAGAAALTGRPWVPPLALGVLGVHYALIVRWEEENLAEKLGEPYLTWCARTPRWIPRRPRSASPPGDWGAALRSERSTLLVLAMVCTLVVGVPWVR